MLLTAVTVTVSPGNWSKLRCDSTLSGDTDPAAATINFDLCDHLKKATGSVRCAGICLPVEQET